MITFEEYQKCLKNISEFEFEQKKSSLKNIFTFCGTYNMITIYKPYDFVIYQNEYYMCKPKEYIQIEDGNIVCDYITGEIPTNSKHFCHVDQSIVYFINYVL